MSRCFPYPPPGYEPRFRSEHKDLLKKERNKVRKHRNKNGTGKGEGKGNERGKGDRKRKDSDHKKLKREKRKERRKNKDRDKDNKTSEQETRKTDDFDNRRTGDKREHDALKEIKCSNQLVAFPDRGGHPNSKVDSTSELLPPSSKGFGATASRKKESSPSSMVKQSGQAAQRYHGMVQKNGSIADTNKKRVDAAIGSKTRIKNGKTLQVGSGEKYSNRRYGGKLKHMERSVQLNGQNKERNKLDEQKFNCDDIKKRKELDANSSLHANGTRTTKLPRMSPTSITSVNGKASPNSHGSVHYSSPKLVGANTHEVVCHKPQDGYSNGIADSRYLEQQDVPVSLSVYDSNEGHLKPPHPDTKYLSQVQSVPPTEKISECVDQDWLFPEDRVERKTSFEAAESHQVWSNAQLIDTADVVALPYVVPL